MKPEMKKLIIANLPYLLFVYLFGKLGQTYRLAAGADLSEKLLHLADGFSLAFESTAPSFHLFDLAVGVAGAVALRLMVYCKSKNAKKYRRGVEYGSARWGGPKDIAPYRFADIIHDLKKKGKTIIIAEHRLYYLMDLTDRFLCVQKGKIVREFTAQQMKALTNKEIQALGLRTPNLHQIEQTEIPSAATSEVVLEVKKLNHSFGETIVSKDIDFQCHKGEAIALIGPNGTGKSTIGRILAGLLKEKSGEVVLFGKHCRPKGRLGKVWYIPQDLDSQLFGEDLLDELTTGAEVNPERKQAAEEILEALELTPFIKQHPSTLSGGQKQRLALGVALMHEAPIIVLDEPTSGLDGTNMRNVSRMI
ncbi:ATP-binding cassette domain-containing protein, partial [Ruthenibacterium lactatiformans]|uniref:ATP-binding cassette domain-containing protein n=1 Tax=Ruthenibacterium lactatiformans TaxID=1550024 RepID=UPI0039F4B92E